MICEKCGKEISDKERRCPYCGASNVPEVKFPLIPTIVVIVVAIIAVIALTINAKKAEEERMGFIMKRVGESNVTEELKEDVDAFNELGEHILDDNYEEYIVE